MIFSLKPMSFACNMRELHNVRNVIIYDIPVAIIMLPLLTVSFRIKHFK